MQSKALVIVSEFGTTINLMPERLRKTEEELLELGYLVDIPNKPSDIEGKVTTLKFDGTNLYYEYEDITPSIDEEVEVLKNDNEILTNYLLDVDYRLVLLEVGL